MLLFNLSTAAVSPCCGRCDAGKAGRDGKEAGWSSYTSPVKEKEDGPSCRLYKLEFELDSCPDG